MNVENDNVLAYAEFHTSLPSVALQNLERTTNLRTLAPQMRSGRVQGRLLSLLSKLTNPRRILEIGTFTAYGTLCLAEGLAADGIVHTVESNQELLYIINHAIASSGFSDQIMLHLGDAMLILEQLEEEWDFVYLDGSKKQYQAYFDLVIDKIRPGGLLVADNVLWGGKVLHDPRTAETAILHAFNKMVQSDQRLENLLLPFSDGLMICRKI